MQLLLVVVIDALPACALVDFTSVPLWSSQVKVSSEDYSHRSVCSSNTRVSSGVCQYLFSVTVVTVGAALLLSPHPAVDQGPDVKQVQYIHIIAHNVMSYSPTQEPL